MIQKGIIAQVIDKYNYKVRIPKYDKIESATYSTKLDDLSSGIVCSIPGIDIAYVEGDVVLVSFENDELSKPVILGLLYREEKKDSDILVKGVDESLTDIKDDLDKLNSQSLFTHLKYSDDNGITFTSLFSSQNYESNVGSAVVCQPYFDDESTIGIKIDKSTKAISWSILDENNTDITDEIEIETIVFDSNNNIIKRERGRNNRLITINNSSKIDGELYLTYRIYTTKKYLDTLHVRLSTDKEPFGVRVGEYVGLYLSFDSTPSTTPADYTWFPIASGAAIDAEINSKIAKLAEEMNQLLNEFKLEVDENFVTLFYKEVTWTQSEVDTYCEIGYQDSWARSPNGYQGAVKAGNILYITVHNTGSSASLEDDTYGRLEIRALEDTPAGQPVNGRVIGYNVSGEVAIDALARFKSSLLEEGNETLIYGGHIETDSITANQIQTNTLQLGQSQIIHLTDDLNSKANANEVVTEINIEYATGNSPTSHSDIQDSDWGTSPIWTAGKYMWQRTQKTIDNIVIETFACIQGAKGEQGDPGSAPTIGVDGYWYINGQSTGVKAEGEDGTGIVSVELYSTSGNNKTYRITFTDGTHFDYVVTDGTDSYTLVLTNESHTFPGSTSAATASSTNCGIIAYKGSSRVACYAGSSASATSIPTGVTGLTCSITSNNTQNVTLTFSATTSLTTQKGEVTIPINVGGEAFEKTFSWSVAYTGSSAAVYNLTATPSALVRNSTSLSPSTVTFNATRTLGTGAPSPYNVYWLIQEFNGTTWVDKYSTPSGSGESSKQYAPTTTAVLVRANIYSEFAHTNLLDTQSVGIAKDGGTPYIQGGYWYINGQSTGIVAEGKDGISIVWKGTLDTPPANPEANWCYRNSTNGITYVYSGTTWVMMTQDGADGADGKMIYGTCATSISTGIKTVTCGVTELYEGLAITVKFSNGNSFMNPSLKVGTTATKNIYVDNAAVNTTNNKLYWTANAVMTFIYDGTGWVLTDKPVSYGATCEAAGATAGKTIYVGEGAVIRKNTTLQCKFTAAHNSSTAATVTIKAASGSDAICSSVPLKINDVNVTNDTCVTWIGGQTVPLVFDGAQWDGAISLESKVEITVDSIDYTNSNITLHANLYVNGLLVTPSTIAYNWTKNNLTNSIGTSQTLTVNDFASIYNCEITW